MVIRVDKHMSCHTSLWIHVQTSTQHMLQIRTKYIIPFIQFLLFIHQRQEKFHIQNLKNFDVKMFVLSFFFKNPVQEWQSLFKCEGEVVIKQAAIGGVLYKKVFLKISKSLEETTCVESPFNLKASCIFIKKRLQHWCFPVKFAKLLRARILKSICVRVFFVRAISAFRLTQS